MCGICGYQGNFQQGLIYKMVELISHRGPDDRGFWENPRQKIALGHTRLAIIDLRPEGRQPMRNENGTILLVCNGEIYNYQQLRKELINKGHKFSSFSDSEVLVHLYEEFGADMLSLLNGIFAFAIYDCEKGELFCARDQLGVKPLYYAQTSNIFAFASELKAILAIPEIPKDIDPQALHNTLSFLWSPGPATMLKAIRKLEPGFALIVKDGRIKRHWQYYDIPYEEQDKIITDESEAIKAVQDGLLTAVERQLMADVPVGAFLSGGLDTSSITAMMKKLRPQEKPGCYTISFAGGKGFEGVVNDLPYARKAAQHLDVELEEVVIDADIVNNIEQMIYILDEPQADIAPLNIMLICQRARRDGMKVLLSGAGGDDIFSGYRRHLAVVMERYWAWLPAPVRELISKVAKKMSVKQPIARKLRKIFENAHLTREQRLIAYFFWLSQNKITELYNSDFHNALGGHDSFRAMEKHLGKIANIKNPLNRMLYLECKTFLPDHNLNYTDKMGMASGIEIRVPLLDIDLVRLSTRIHPNLKQHSRVGKYIFKKAMEDYLPSEIIYRPKSAIPSPVRTWLLGDLKEMVYDILSTYNIKKRGWFNPQAVQKLLADNKEMEIDASYSIWAMVSMEIWARLFLDRCYTHQDEENIRRIKQSQTSTEHIMTRTG